MSTKPFDFLTSEKEPLLYVEATIICMNDGFLTALSGKEGTRTLAPSGTLVLMLGTGTSITQEAAIFAALHDMQIAFARGRCNVHSFFMSGRYQDPLSITHQVRLVDTQKLEVARQLMTLRLTRNREPVHVIHDAVSQPDMTALLAWEARWTKQVYKGFAVRAGSKFTRDFDASDSVNSKLNVLNNALYSICTAICLSCGLHPSVGFLHGYTRRGGLAFDLADIYKNELTLPIAFNASIPGTREAMYELARHLRANNYGIVKQLIKICLLVGGQHSIQWEDL